MEGLRETEHITSDAMIAVLSPVEFHDGGCLIALIAEAGLARNLKVRTLNCGGILSSREVANGNLSRLGHLDLLDSADGVTGLGQFIPAMGEHPLNRRLSHHRELSLGLRLVFRA